MWCSPCLTIFHADPVWWSKKTFNFAISSLWAHTQIRSRASDKYSNFLTLNQSKSTIGTITRRTTKMKPDFFLRFCKFISSLFFLLLDELNRELTVEQQQSASSLVCKLINYESSGVLSFRHPWKDQSDSVYNHSVFVMGWLRVSHIRNAKKDRLSADDSYELAINLCEASAAAEISQDCCCLFHTARECRRRTSMCSLQQLSASVSLIILIQKIKLDIKEEASTGVWQKKDISNDTVRETSSKSYTIYESPDWFCFYFYAN